jgi:two-component system alkaline phosphatase synthesis response regulator PhoP
MTNPHALIIEDDADVAAFLTQTLRNAGFDTETSGDGQAALLRLRETVPDVVVLDLNLPHIPGDELLRYIRREPRLSRTQVILTTGEAQMADSVQNEADLVLLKPVSYSQLRDLALRLRTQIRPDDPPTEAPDA